ncbi:MAG: hypothetical protein N2111_14415, partial [Candidatus Sumerlaeaceae bacterium]|nr:hypothetical protein [Candidatus Sumerlaeaceae bacterium]
MTRTSNVATVRTGAGTIAAGLQATFKYYTAIIAGIFLVLINHCQAALSLGEAVEITAIPRMSVRATVTIETSVTQGSGKYFEGHPVVTAHVQAWYDRPHWLAYVQLDTDQACLVEGHGWKPTRYWTRGDKWLFGLSTWGISDFVREVTPWLASYEFSELLRKPPHSVFHVRTGFDAVTTGSLAVVLDERSVPADRNRPQRIGLFYRVAEITDRVLTGSSYWDNIVAASGYPGAEAAFYADNFLLARTTYRDHATTAGGLPMTAETYRYQNSQALGRHCFQRITTVVTHVEPLARNWKPES